MWKLQGCVPSLFPTNYTPQPAYEADDEKSDYEKRIEENKRSLQEEVERAMIMNNAELEVCYFDHDHVCKIPSLVPMPPPFLLEPVA